jgi:daunorubicin resistance ABC transporter ATP-binding subunit
MADNQVAVRDVAKRFGQVTALDGITFTVPAGTIFGLLGPNGSGKTTMVRILTTIIKPDRGEAQVSGFDVTRQSDAVRMNIGLAGQAAAVDPNLTGAENLRLIGKLSQMSTREIPARVGELLERFDLVAAAGRTVRTYSGGMRRRLDVAASLVHRPSVLLLDEPTTGLDPTSRGVLWDLIRNLVATGTTVLLTTQYLDEADRLAHRLAVLDSGRIIAEGRPAELKAQMGSTVIELGFGDDRGRAARAAQVLDRFGAETADTVVRLTSTDSPRLLVEALNRLDTDGLAPATVAVREPSLDDVFHALTTHSASTAPTPRGESTAAAPRGET